MRAILVLIGLAAVVLVVLMSLGMVQLNMHSGSLPSLTVSGGKAPTVKADVGKIDIGTTSKTVSVPTVQMTNTTVQVPTLHVEKAGNSSAAQ